MAVFEWNQFNSSGAKISRYVQGFRCRTTNIVAYYIPDKHNINIDFEFDGEFEPLKNNYGIYFLLGDTTEADKKPAIYIGQASTREEPKGMDRLKEHINLTTDWYKDKWDSVLYVTSTDNSWSTSLIDTLERLFIACFRNREEYTCLNGKKGKDGNIPDKDFKTELLAITDLLALPMFGYMVSNDTKSGVINSVYDKLVEMANDLKEELKEELKAEYLNQYNPEDRKRIEWVKQAEAYDSFKSSIELANNYVFSGRILNGSKGEVITPEEIARQMVDLIPADAFHSKARFFDPACKSGIYLKCLIDRFMSDDEDLPINHEPEYADKYKRLKNLIENQLYGICLSRNGHLVSNRRVIETVERYADEITRGRFTRSVLDSITVLPNIIYISGYESMVKNEPLFLTKVLKDRFSIEDGDTLKFDVVIGNPPYNKGMDLDFVALCFDRPVEGKDPIPGLMKDTGYGCFIIPAKWQTAEADQRISSSISYGQFRSKIVPHMSNIVFYPDASDVFDIGLKGGVSYFIIDSKIHVQCKVTNVMKQKPIIGGVTCRNITNQQTLLNIANEIVEHIADKYTKFTFGDLDKKYVVSNCNKIIGASGCCFNKDGTASVLPSSTVQERVCFSIIDADKNDIVFSADTEMECKSFVSYVYSKLVRFLIIANMSTLGPVFKNSYFRFVPAPPSGKFDHIYTDEELYKAFNLPQKYIDVIEAVVKERK